MTESAPTYRYWGHTKPTALAPLTAAEPANGTAAMKIYGPIDDWGAPFGVSADEFGAALAALGADVKSIQVHVHSPGGMAFEGLAIMNQLRQHPADVEVVVDGLCASAASIIAMGANKVTMAPGAQMMIHDASGICVGTAEDMQTMFTRLDSLSANYADQYAAKAGGKSADWRSAMQPESWYSAQEAVDAGLADAVLPPKPSDMAPKAEFDLSIFAHAGRSAAPAPAMPAKASLETPAPVPVHPPKKGAVMLTDSEIKALSERLGLPEDANAAAIQAKVDELAARPAEPTEPVALTDEAIAAHYGIDADKVKAAVAAAKTEKVAVSQSYLDSLEANAKLGAEARAEQLAKARDEAIDAKIGAGFIGRDTRASWQRDWDRDPAGTQAELDKFTVVRYPIGDAPGVAGTVDDTSASYTDEMRAEDAQLWGIPEGAFSA